MTRTNKMRISRFTSLVHNVSFQESKSCQYYICGKISNELKYNRVIVYYTNQD